MLLFIQDIHILYYNMVLTIFPFMIMWIENFRKVRVSKEKLPILKNKHNLDSNQSVAFFIFLWWSLVVWKFMVKSDFYKIQTSNKGKEYFVRCPYMKWFLLSCQNKLKLRIQSNPTLLVKKQDSVVDFDSLFSNHIRSKVRSNYCNRTN